MENKSLKLYTGMESLHLPLQTAVKDQDFAISAIECSNSDWRGERVWGGNLRAIIAGFKLHQVTTGCKGNPIAIGEKE